MRPTRPYLTESRPPAAAPAAAAAPTPAGKPDPATAPGRFRRLTSRGAESMMAILLTLGCFLTLLLVMSYLLPSATDLGSLLSPVRRETQEARSGLGESLGELSEPDQWAKASLSVLDNQVMRKESASIAWRPVRSGAQVTEGDGIQTTREGMAVVAFDQQNRVRLGRNSLVVLRRPEREGLGGLGALGHPSAAASFTVVSGDLWGDFRGTSDAPPELEIRSGNTVTRLESSGPNDRTQFKVTVRPDKSSAIAIYRGTAEVSTGGATVPVAPNQVVVVDADGVARAPVTLPSPPEAVGPPTGESRVYREFPPRLSFEWRPVEGAEEYRLLIARDPGLIQVVADERTKDSKLSIGGIPAGHYWWSVTTIRDAVDGRPSAPRTLTLVEDQMGPQLEVHFGATRTQAASVTLEGTAEPGARVFVRGEAAVMDGGGAFRIVTPLVPGINLVVVEAVDAAGNTSYRSQEILRVADGGARNP